jgi:molybdopterin converting factor small subunit
VNDVLVLHRARRHPLMDGDTVEIVPTIAGG